MKLFYCILLFVLLHILSWFASNSQLINDNWEEKSFLIMIAASIPIGLCEYYGTKIGYEALDSSAWGVRFVAFGASYLIFPILTYFMLGESMLTLKTMICILLSIIMIAVQIIL